MPSSYPPILQFLTTDRFENFVNQLQTVTVLARILAQFNKEAAAALWGNLDQVLAYVISLLKPSPANVDLLEMIENLVTSSA